MENMDAEVQNQIKELGQVTTERDRALQEMSGMAFLRILLSIKNVFFVGKVNFI